MCLRLGTQTCGTIKEVLGHSHFLLSPCLASFSCLCYQINEKFNLVILWKKLPSILGFFRLLLLFLFFCFIILFFLFVLFLAVSNKIYLSSVLKVVLVGCNSNSTLKMLFSSFFLSLSLSPLPPFTELIYQKMPGNLSLGSIVFSKGFGMSLPLHRRTFCLLRVNYYFFFIFTLHVEYPLNIKSLLVRDILFHYVLKNNLNC